MANWYQNFVEQLILCHWDVTPKPLSLCTVQPRYCGPLNNGILAITVNPDLWSFFLLYEPVFLPTPVTGSNRSD